MDDNYSKVVKELKALFQKEKLSVIVGAGFSKNANKDAFLDWRGLLKDMIVEMYGGEIRRNNQQYKSNSCYAIYQDEQINEIINRLGYLEIASEYIRRKGFREAIDIYIEGRTPQIEKNNDEYRLFKNGKDIGAADLTVHKKLLELKWNNVYTFNYDHLLDTVGDTEKQNKLSEKIEALTSELEAQKRTKNEKENELEKINNQNKSFQEKEQKSYDVVKQEKPVENQESNDLELETLENEIEKIGKDIADKEDRWKELKKQEEGCYQLIDNSWKISLRQKRNIIKLHGNLRKNHNKEYGFDNDQHKQYIISKDDYDTYPKKHEAFMNLMRIALLQESFCLIGFSGDDPNFLSWIGWVRDILIRRPSNPNGSKKIFFVDVSGKPLSQERKQLFDNHSIENISLFEDSSSVTSESIKSKLCDFLDKLCLDQDRAINEIDNYNSILGGLNTQSLGKLDLPDGDIDLLWNSLDYNRIPKLNSGSHYKRDSIISNIPQIINRKLIDNKTAKLILLSIKGEMLPLDTIVQYDNNDSISEVNNLIKQVAIQKELVKYFDLLDIRSKILHNECIDTYQKDDDYIYESVLQAAFQFDFQRMKQVLDDWNPTNNLWRAKQLALISLFDRSDATTVFEKYINCIDDINVQEQIYFIEIYGLVRNKKTFGSNNQINQDVRKRINDLKVSPLNGIGNNIDYLKNELRKKEIDTNSYGRTSSTINIGGQNSSLIYSIQLLQLFIEIGIPMHGINIIYLDKEIWYISLKNIFERYPYPAMFYSLQYGDDKDFIKKIAQDFAYSNSLVEIVPDILKRMLEAYLMKDTPRNFKNGILIASSVFFKCVEPKVWSTLFKTIYNGFNFSDNDINRAILNPAYDFFSAGISLLKDSTFKVKILNYCLKKCNNIDNIDNSMIISAMHGLGVSFHANTYNLINKLIKEAKEPAHYYVLFNLKSKLSEEQLEKLNEKLLYFDYASCNDSTMLEAASSIAKGDLLLKLRSGIIENQLLWRNGISNNNGIKTVSGYLGHSIDLNYVQNYLRFNKIELMSIYEKMKNSFQIIEEYKDSEKSDELLSFITDWDFLFLQMYLFMKNNKNMLRSKSDYNDLFEQIKNQDERILDGSIKDALVSNKDSNIRFGIQKLVYEIQSDGVAYYQDEYIIIANRIILKNENALNSCIRHFAWSIEKYQNDFNRVVFGQLISLILNIYQPYFEHKTIKWDLNAAKEDVENAMIKINSVAKKWGISNRFWSKYKRHFYI